MNGKVEAATFYCLDMWWECLHVFCFLLVRVFDSERELKRAFSFMAVLHRIVEPNEEENIAQICLLNVVFTACPYFMCTK